MILGGLLILNTLKGYSGGNSILPWNLPRANGVFGGPLTVKCHSNKSFSKGDAVNSGDGSDNSCLYSFNSRLFAADIVGEFSPVVSCNSFAGRVYFALLILDTKA